ncbi:MAG: VCBS repeat-containing protein, partial [Byssovorax sp.]
GLKVRGAAFFGDANADDFADVFVGAVDCSKGPESCEIAEIDVAYGDGNGEFSAVANSDPSWSPDALGKASTYLNVFPKGDTHSNPKGQLTTLEIERYLPLAIGRFNTDPAIDYVNAFGIYISNGGSVIGCNSAPNGYCEADRPSGGDLWLEARASDFNANGSVDVAAISRGVSGIDFFSGTGAGVFNTFSIPTEGAPSSLTVGDFDGDFLPDIAFDSGTTKVGGDASTLFVAFGRAIGAPELPVSMGKVANLRQIVSGDLGSFGNNAASDIVLLSGIPATHDDKGNEIEPGKSWTVGLSQGNGYRQLQAPLTFFEKKTLRIGASPLASAIGRFDGEESNTSASHADVAAVMQSFRPTAMTEMGDAPFCLLQASLWVLPATGDAAIEPPAVGVRSIPLSTLNPMLPDHFLPLRNLVETVPIDVVGEDTQKLVIAFPTYDECTSDLTASGAHGKLLLASFDAGGQPTLKELISSVGDNEFLVRLRVGDIDGDGLPDIAALQRKLDLASGQFKETSLVVLRGKDSFDKRITVPLPGSPVDFALVNTDQERGLEIVAVSAREDSADPLADLVVVDWDESAENPSPPFKILFPRGAGGGDSPTDNSEGSVLDRPSALAGGDFDGDGVDDVAVAIAGGIRVLRGVAR